MTARRERREDALREIGDVLALVIGTALTFRQREILVLYCNDGLREPRIAAMLGISQPTVSQHLTGKLRGGRKVGGALRKLRKGLKMAAARGDLPARDRQVAAALGTLVSASLTRQRVSALLKSPQSGPWTWHIFVFSCPAIRKVPISAACI